MSPTLLTTQRRLPVMAGMIISPVPCPPCPPVGSVNYISSDATLHLCPTLHGTEDILFIDFYSDYLLSNLPASQNNQL